MKNYEILEHVADLKIRAFGETKADLFLNMMKGMMESLKPERIKKGEKRKIKINSPDLGALLVDFLSEVLYLVETKKETYQKVNFKKLTKNEIEAELVGKKLKRMGVHIKAVTHHDLDIHQREDGVWEAIALFDI